jgi:hypothetical protein
VILIPIMFVWCIVLTLCVIDLWLANLRSERRADKLNEMLRITQKGQESMRWTYGKEGEK